MKTIEYFAPGFNSIEEVEAAHGPLRDGTTLSKVTQCPFYYDFRVNRNLEPKVMGLRLIAGIAMHEALELYYSYSERGPEVEAQAVEAFHASYSSFPIDMALVEPGAVHLTAEHLEGCLRNYFREWTVRKIDIYEPIPARPISELNLDQVLAAKFKVNDEDLVVLGESSLVMKFNIEGETLVLAGKPDLAVRTSDRRYYSMDHKTTSQYLSDWWAKDHEVSNKDRGYLAMLQSLLDIPMHGTIINGIYVGKSALSERSNATRSERYVFPATPNTIHEALRNQLWWNKIISFCEGTGYFPQGCTRGGCKMPGICRTDPVEREQEVLDNWQPCDRHFWNL